MGGLGSGYQNRRKSTVEESLVLAVGDFFRRRRSKSSGTIAWTWASGHSCSVRYVVDFGSLATVTLRYRFGDREDVRIPIRLETTPTNFNGERW
jgi:hypothetical protein